MSGELINETALGIDEMVDDFEASYLRSVEHNETDTNDLEYLRRYVWTSLAIMVNRQRDLEKRIFFLEKGKKKK